MGGHIFSMYDVAIIGGGARGATLARLIGESYRVLLVDKREFADSPGTFSARKCRGVLLAPDAQRMLSKLGLGLPKSVLEEPQLFVVKATDIQQGLESYYQRHYINMDRQKFDCWLLSLIPSGVDLRLNCRLKSYSSENNFFKLTLVQNGKTYVEKTRILVGADGAISKVRLQMSARNPLPKKYCAIQEWVDGSDNFPYFTSLFDPEITDYYCWNIPKGEHLIIGAALHPKQNVAEKFNLFKKQAPKLWLPFRQDCMERGGFCSPACQDKTIVYRRKGNCLDRRGCRLDKSKFCRGAQLCL